MGSSETDTASEPPKASAAQEQQLPTTGAAPTVFPDWSRFQAYSPIPPHGFFQSPVASSPQAHPYMWGAQHLMPPYGTPPPPYVMYPPGGLYAHPSIPPGSHPFSPYVMPSQNNNAEASGVASGGAELDGKSSEGKDRSPIRRSKESLGSLNMITGKSNNELDKISGASANGGYSHSGESGSEGSSDSDANSQNGSQPKTSGGQDTFNGEQVPQNGTTARGSQNGVGHAPSHGMPNPTLPMMAMPAGGAPGGIAGPTTNLNIGLESWNAPARPMGPPIRGKVPAPGVAGTVIPSGMSGSRENIPAVLWQQDERELKRQRRKQANRESARRSRLRKQAECDELAQRVESLQEENTLLRAELDLVMKEHEQLVAHNTDLKGRLGETSTLSDKNGDETQKHNNH